MLTNSDRAFPVDRPTLIKSSTLACFLLKIPKVLYIVYTKGIQNKLWAIALADFFLSGLIK